jgi:hypothetical protein
MPRGSNQRGRARTPKPKKLTKQKKYQGETAAGIFGMRKVRKGGIWTWVPKDK